MSKPTFSMLTVNKKLGQDSGVKTEDIEAVEATYMGNVRGNVGIYSSMNGALLVDGVAVRYPAHIFLVPSELHPSVLKPSLHLQNKIKKSYMNFFIDQSAAFLVSSGYIKVNESLTCL